MDELIRRCQEERAAYRSEGDGASPACLELLRLAFSGEPAAWDQVYTLFEPLMRAWAVVPEKIRPGYIIEPNDVIQEAFISFRRAAPKKPEILASGSLGPVLMYLKRCIKSAALKLQRKEEPHIMQPASEEAATVVTLVALSEDINLAAPEQVEDYLDRRLFASQLQAVVVKTDQDRFVFQAYFVDSLKPRKVFEEGQRYFQEMKQLQQVIQTLHRRILKVLGTVVRNQQEYIIFKQHFVAKQDLESIFDQFRGRFEDLDQLRQITRTLHQRFLRFITGDDLDDG